MVRSGQITVATAGTAVQAGDDEGVRSYLLRAHPANTNDVYIGNDGSNDVTGDNGFILATTDPWVPFRGALSELWVDVETNGEKLCWMVVQ